MANYELSNRIYELRTQKGLSQKELGAILGVSNKAVSKWETGTAIPKTETLIKLAEVFGISTEELLNMAIPLQVSQQSVEETITYPTNARIGKTLSEFRAEHGLYLKDVAEKTGIDENELQKIEDSGLVPDEIANKLVVAYNLSENNFARLVYKSKKVIKKYFLKTAFIYEIIVGAICAIPSVIGGILTAIGVLFDAAILEEVSTYFTIDLYWMLSVIVAMVGGIKLGKYLTEKSDYLGDFNKYRFLYSVVPGAASVTINALSNFVLGLIYYYLRANTGGVASKVDILVQGAIELIFAVASTAVTVIILAMLMNNVIEQNSEKARAVFKKIAIITTISGVTAYIIEFFDSRIWWNEGSFQWITHSNGFDLIGDCLPHAVNIAIVWLVYSITESNSKKEKWAFKILPLISIWGIFIIEIIGLIEIGFDYLLGLLADSLFSLF